MHLLVIVVIREDRSLTTGKYIRLYNFTDVSLKKSYTLFKTYDVMEVFFLNVEVEIVWQ